jgi:hypothetical protein
VIGIILHIIAWLAGRPYAIIHDPWFELPYTLAIIGVPIFLIVYFARRKHNKAKVSPSCPNCGIVNNMSYRFCGNCGTQLKR